MVIDLDSSSWQPEQKFKSAVWNIYDGRYKGNSPL